MIRFVALLVFFLWLLSLHPTQPIDETISLRWLPFLPANRLDFSLVLFGVGTIGLCYAAVMSIFDQLGLRKQNRLLRRETETLKKELSSLRAMLNSRD